MKIGEIAIDLKTLIWIGSLLITILTGYFTFKSELDSRFDELEDTDNSQVVELEKKFTELENKFTPIGEGVYAVDPKTTWPPSRNEYKMKGTMQVNQIKVLAYKDKGDWILEQKYNIGQKTKPQESE